MEEQIKLKNPTLHRYLFTVTTFSKLLAMFLFILLPFVGFYLGMKYQQQLNPSATTQTQLTYNQIHKALLPQPIPSPATSVSTSFSTPSGKITIDASGNWKTFTSTQYGFQITFPAKGFSYDPNCKGNIDSCLHETECGNQIFQNRDNQEFTDIYIDDFFGIYINNTTKTISDLIAQANDNLKQYNLTVNDIYNITQITQANADEAISFKAKPNVRLPVGQDGIPFSFTIAIYEKSGKLFELTTGQGAGGNGCYKPLKSVSWNIPNSFKFL